MKLKAINNKIVVEKISLEEESATESGIILITKQSKHNNINVGKVLSVSDKISKELGLNIDDNIIYETGAESVYGDFDGNALIHAADVLAVLDPTTDVREFIISNRKGVKDTKIK